MSARSNPVRGSLALAAAVVAVSCGFPEYTFVDDDQFYGTGGAGATGGVGATGGGGIGATGGGGRGGGGTGGTGGGGTGGSGTGGSGTGGSGTGGSGTGGTGGGTGCVSCAQILAGGDPKKVCTGAEATKWKAIEACACGQDGAGKCTGELCFTTCNSPNSTPDASCKTCMQTNCATAYNNCKPAP